VHGPGDVAGIDSNRAVSDLIQNWYICTELVVHKYSIFCRILSRQQGGEIQFSSVSLPLLQLLCWPVTVVRIQMQALLFETKTAGWVTSPKHTYFESNTRQASSSW